MSVRHLEFVERVWQSFLDARGLDFTVLAPMRLTYAEYGRLQCSLGLERRHLNRMGNLHGGTTATLVDVVGSLAIASRGYFATGVTTELSCSYPRSGGVLNEEISIDGICDSVGKNMAYTHVIFTNAKGQVFARGSHNKFMGGSIDHVQNMIEQLRPKSK